MRADVVILRLVQAGVIATSYGWPIVAVVNDTFREAPVLSGRSVVFTPPPVAEGQFFNAHDMKQYAAVVVLGLHHVIQRWRWSWYAGGVALVVGAAALGTATYARNKDYWSLEAIVAADRDPPAAPAAARK